MHLSSADVANNMLMVTNYFSRYEASVSAYQKFYFIIKR